MCPRDPTIDRPYWETVTTVDENCVAQHSRIIQQNQLQAAALTAQLTTLAAEIDQLGRAVPVLQSQRSLMEEELGRLRDRERDAEPIRQRHRAVYTDLCAVRDRLFSSHATLFKEVLAHLEQSEESLAARVAELRSKQASEQDPVARFDLEVLIRQLELLRVLRSRAPRDVPFLTYLAQELDKPEGSSAIRSEDRAFLLTLVRSGHDLSAAEQTMRDQLRLMEEIIGLDEKQRREDAAQQEALVQRLTAKVAEHVEAQAGLLDRQRSHEQVSGALRHANAIIAQQQQFLASDHCKRTHRELRR